MRSLSEKYRRAVVTGASSGIGHSLAKQLLRAGLEVTGISRSKPAIEHPAFRHIALDLSDATQRADTLEELARVPPDLWINNAGFGLMGSTFEIDPADREALWQLLYFIPVETVRWFRETWQQSDQRRATPPCLVQVSSLAVELPIPYMADYNAAKSALSAFTQSLLLETKLNLRLIDFRPGDFNTPFIDQPGLSRGGAPERFDERLRTHHRRAPHPDLAATQLCRMLGQDRSGTLRSGHFFQRTMAPLGPRLLSQGALRSVIKKYYGLK